MAARTLVAIVGALALAVASPVGTQSVTRTSSRTPASRTASASASPSVASPTQTSTSSPFPLLTAEQWGMYDTTLPSPTLQPVVLLRDSIDGHLYVELPNYVDAANSPPTNAQGERATRVDFSMVWWAGCSAVSASACR